MKNSLLELSCDSCPETIDLSLSERVGLFREALKDKESLSELNINGENFLHLLLWDFPGNKIKTDLLKEFSQSSISKEDKKELFFKKSDDDEAPIDYFIETLEDREDKEVDLLALNKLFNSFTVEETLQIMLVEKQGEKENFGHTISYLNENLFLEMILFKDRKRKNLSELQENEKVLLIELLKSKDSDGESIFTSITDDKLTKLTDEEILNAIDIELDDLEKQVNTRGSVKEKNKRSSQHKNENPNKKATI